MSKLKLIGLASGLLVGVIMYITLKPSDDTRKVAIVLTVSHPALDDAKNSFISQLKDIEVSPVIFNAEGNMQQANMIATQIAQNSSIKAVFSIGTLATQAIAQKIHDKPVIFAAVSHPKGIIKKNQSNVCGLSDDINANFQIDSIKKLLPRINKISLLYTPHEANSSYMANNIKVSAKQKGIYINEVGVIDAQTIRTSAIRACSLSDAVLIPLDNQLVASMPTVHKAVKNMNCIIIASNESPIHEGAAIAFGVDYKKSGQRAAKITSEILAGYKTPADYKIIIPQTLDIFVNDTVLMNTRSTINEGSIKNLIHIKKEA